jgi:pimeloyl-ACP methyl ester carboxylesterase
MILNYKGAKVFYEVFGQGEPIVLIHGFLENRKFLPEFSKKHQIVVVDLLGHGKSDCLGYIHTIDDFSYMVLEVINHLKLNNYKLVGHSLGGYVALHLAEKELEHLSGICLLNSTTLADDKARISIRNRAIINAKKFYEPLISMSISNLFFEANRKTYDKEIEAIKVEALKTPVQGYIAAQEGMKLRKDQTNFFKNLDIKKYIIAGKNDPVIYFEAVKEIAKITNSEFVVINGGHMSHIEAFAETQKALLKFIQH